MVVSFAPNAIDLEDLRNDLSGTSVVFLHYGIQSLLASSSDIDLGSIGNQSLSDHQANASATTSNDSDKAIDSEELRGFELFVFECVLCHCACDWRCCY